MTRRQEVHGASVICINVYGMMPATCRDHDTMPTDFEQFEPLIAALGTLVILSLILERALSLVFEWGGWRDWIRTKHLRAPIAFAAAYTMCVSGQFDVLAAISTEVNGYQGMLSIGTFVTAAVIAGGSKGAILLFQGVLGFGRRDAVKARIDKTSAAPATTPSQSSATTAGAGDPAPPANPPR